MAKPILRFKVNQQSAEVGGKFYGIIEDTPVTPENSILQICEFKKITAFTPEQVLRLVEDVCDGAAKLVARDGLSRQLSSLLKFSPRVRGTFNAVDSRWSDQKLIVGARLLKDIKLDMNPSDFVMSNVADVGTLTSAAFVTGVLVPESVVNDMPDGGFAFRVNGSKLDTWDGGNTSVKIAAVADNEVYISDSLAFEFRNFAPNGFLCETTYETTPTVRAAFGIPSGVPDGTPVEFVAVVYHPDASIEFKRLNIQRWIA